ncbi:MAG: hypothetical protein ACTHJR_14735 [Sphingomonas sp.]|uniref:hypothetical protein n=1 Tax=Sphingomonas sp. TaxID=28214 RepID=UPI003F7F2D91
MPMLAPPAFMALADADGEQRRGAPLPKKPMAMSGMDQTAVDKRISEQIRPCIARQASPGPGAERIRVLVDIELTRDGRLMSVPKSFLVDGVDASNARYRPVVEKYAIEAITACAPIPDLPPQFYNSPGGWRHSLVRYSLSAVISKGTLSRSFRAMTESETIDVAQKIRVRLQPCLNRRVSPDASADPIRVVARVRFNRDGSLAASPTIMRRDGVTAANARYVSAIDESLTAAIVECAPFSDLPPDLYDVRNGWSDIRLRMKLPGKER